jgi:DSF synthase
MNSIVKKPSEYDLTKTHELYQQLKTHYDSEYKIAWLRMNAAPRACFTPTLLNNLNTAVNNIKKEMIASDGNKYDYLVLSSDVSEVFNLGGDLSLFRQLIEQRDYDGLLSYAMDCISIVYANFIHFNLDLTTVSIVQGDALGGGFEAALSSNLLIAERGVKLGLPEVLFNLFPGMGAYTLLSRKVGPALAERMILSGKIYRAEELYEMGIVDILAEPGQGELELYKHIRSVKRYSNSHRAINKVKDIANRISFDELTEITKVWVDSALSLTNKDLRMMDRLITRQTSKAH